MVFLFRSLKVFEEPWAKRLSVDDEKPFNKERDGSKYDCRLCVILAAAYVVCMFGAFDFSFREIRNIFA